MKWTLTFRKNLEVQKKIKNFQSQFFWGEILFSVGNVMKCIKNRFLKNEMDTNFPKKKVVKKLEVQKKSKFVRVKFFVLFRKFYYLLEMSGNA